MGYETLQARLTTVRIARPEIVVIDMNTGKLFTFPGSKLHKDAD